MTPLALACRERQCAMGLKLLLSRGRIRSAVNQAGENVVDDRFETGNVELVTRCSPKAPIPNVKERTQDQTASDVGGGGEASGRYAGAHQGGRRHPRAFEGRLQRRCSLPPAAATSKALASS